MKFTAMLKVSQPVAVLGSETSVAPEPGPTTPLEGVWWLWDVSGSLELLTYQQLTWPFVFPAHIPHPGHLVVMLTRACPGDERDLGKEGLKCSTWLSSQLDASSHLPPPDKE